MREVYYIGRTPPPAPNKWKRGLKEVSKSKRRTFFWMKALTLTTTPFGVGLWRSIRILWSEFKTYIKIKVVNGAKLIFGEMNGMRQEDWKMCFQIFMH